MKNTSPLHFCCRKSTRIKLKNVILFYKNPFPPKDTWFYRLKNQAGREYG